MTNRTYTELQSALDAFLGDDDSANVTVVDRDRGPSVAIIRADVYQSMRAELAALKSRLGEGDEEDGRDAFSILNED